MSGLSSPKIRSNSSISQPTFADGPASFLQQLAAVVQSSSTGTGGSSEIHRVRGQLTSEVQSTHSKQQMRMRQLESQLSLLQQKIRPRLQNIERQQGFTQNQLDSLRGRVQALISEDISPLQQKFEQLGLSFDRFLRVDLESKLRPIQDELRGSRTKLDELMSAATGGFQKINEEIEDIQNGVETTSSSLALQKTKFDKRINDIIPKLNELEGKIKELQVALEGSQMFGAGFASLDKELKAAMENVQYIQNEYIPGKIAEASAGYEDRIGYLSSKCDSSLISIQGQLDGIIASNQQAEVERKAADKNLTLLFNASFEIESQLKSIESETSTKLGSLKQEIDSKIAQIRSSLADIANTTEDGDRQQANLDASIEELRHGIEGSLRELREKIRTNSSKNMKAQQSIYSLLNGLKNTLEGETNLIGQLKNIELQVDWCVNAIQIIDKERVAAQEVGADPVNLIARAKNIDERVSGALARIHRFDNTNKKASRNNKQAAKPAEQPDDNPPANEDGGEKTVTKKKKTRSNPPPEEENQGDPQPDNNDQPPPEDNPPVEENQPAEEAPKKKKRRAKNPEQTE